MRLLLALGVAAAAGCSGAAQAPPADAGSADSAPADVAEGDAPGAADGAMPVDAGAPDAAAADASGCGNGAIDEGEECEGADLGGRDCVDLGFDVGALDCGADCLYDTTGCLQIEICDNGLDDDGDAVVDCEDSSCAGEFPCPRCGNGVADPGEECDSPDLRGYDCMDFGFAGGILACGACLFDTGGCTGEVCAGGIDEDGDALIDCGDPDCDPFPACGHMPTGDPCALGSDCDGGVCFDEASTGYLNGYCTELCDLAAGLCGSDGDAWCIDDGTSATTGHCYAACVVVSPGTDCRTGYRCNDTLFGVAVCLPE